MVNNPLNTPQREVAGRTTIIKFDYQFHWALLKALQYYKEDTDFILCVEFHDDVLFVLCDNPALPLTHKNDTIKLIQVKALKNACTKVSITKTSKKDPNSIIGKMILGMSGKGFEDKVSSLGLVSASGFSNLKHRDDNDYETVYLTDLPKETLNFLTEKIDKEFNAIDSIKKKDLLSKIALINTSLKEDNMRPHLIGEISETLEKKFKNDYYRASDIYVTLIDEMRKKCSIPYNYRDWYDFKKNKGLTNDDIDTVKNTHQRDDIVIRPSELIPDLKFPLILKLKINHEFAKHHNLLLDKAKNVSEYKLYTSIREMLNSNTDLLTNDLNIKDLYILKDKLSEETLYLTTGDEHTLAAIIYGIESLIQEY